MPTIIDIVKKVLNRGPKKESPPDALTDFNVKTNNTICSAFTSLAAIKGHHIEVRENTFIDSACSLGSYTYVGMNSAITKTAVGRYCSIANNVSIGPGEHDLSAISTSAFFYQSAMDTLTQKDCSIGNDVWIGVDCIIKRGVKIEDGAVVGANSVVTKDVPAFAIVAGSPATIIRYRFKKKNIAMLLKLAWWNYELEEARQLQENFQKTLQSHTDSDDHH